MTATLVCSRVFSPWSAEPTRLAAAFLEDSTDGPVDVVRADLDATLPRARPRPAIDAAIRHTVSVGFPDDPATWADLGAYAESAVRTARAWRDEGDGWVAGYSGPMGLADHLSLALLRGLGVVPAWTAHVSDLPTHDAAGARRLDPVAEGALLATCRRLLGGWNVPLPTADLAADWVLALVAGGADRIVVADPALADALLTLPAWRDLPALADRIEVWTRPPVPMPRRVGADRIRITTHVDALTLPILDPVLRAAALLPPGERDRIRLVLYAVEPAPVATALRRHALEDAVEVVVDDGSPCPGGDLALVVDPPVPDGMPCFPAPPADLADAEASGIPVILLAPQDSPRTRHPAAHHLPTEHVSAARALLSRLAEAPRQGSPEPTTARG